jgi:hypothetical protein
MVGFAAMSLFKRSFFAMSRNVVRMRRGGVSMAVDETKWLRELNFNDTIVYQAAVPPWDGRHADYQVREQGPYVGKVVDFVDWGVGVRADGWMGEAPLYYVYLADIIGVVRE